MDATLADLFSLVQEILGKELKGYDALDGIRIELSKRRRNKRNQSLINNLRKGARIVLIQLPEKCLTAFFEGLGKAAGGGVAP